MRKIQINTFRLMELTGDMESTAEACAELAQTMEAIPNQGAGATNQTIAALASDYIALSSAVSDLIQTTVSVLRQAANTVNQTDQYIASALRAVEVSK